MTDRPILFSAPMIRALLDGRKFQTRRVIKPQPSDEVVRANGYWFDRARGDDSREITRIMTGDRLRVRENFAPLTACKHNDPGSTAMIYSAFFAADQSTTEGDIDRWTPSIHMPRSLSRLTLIVTDVRVEKLQNISQMDAVAEGIEEEISAFMHAGWKLYDQPGMMTSNAVKSYASLWRTINGADAWAANPWVVAISFTTHHCNIDRTPKP